MKKHIGIVFLIVSAIILSWIYFSGLRPPSSKIKENDETKITGDKRINESQVRKLIGQMLIVGFRGTSIDEDSYIVQKIKNLNLGGIILFDYDVPTQTKGRNITDPAQTKKLISDIVSYTATPLFISIDAEGGVVNRLKPAYGFVDVPSHESLGNKPKEETLRTAKILGKELSELGINFDFAPVVDLNVNRENPIIGKLGRSFGDDPQLVYEYASEFISGLHAFDILTSIKHFPGHGSSDADSHLGIVDVTKTYKKQELEPFKNLIKNKHVDTVMVAHVFNRTIDPDYPASLSEKFIRDILRKELGFEGVVISDDMDMGAIRKNYGFEDAVVKAIMAGTDMLIISNNGDVYDESSPERAIDAIWNAIQSRKISLSDIYDSAKRIEALKEKIK